MLSHVQLFAAPWTVALKAPLSMEFSRKEYWSGLPLPTPGALPDPGIKPTSLVSLVSPTLAGRFFNISATWEGPGLIISGFFFHWWKLKHYFTRSSIDYFWIIKRKYLMCTVYEEIYELSEINSWKHIMILLSHIYIRLKTYKDYNIGLKWSRSVVSNSATPWTVAYQAPLSMGFSRQEYWSGLPFPSPGDLPNPAVKARSPALQADTLPSEPPGKSL